MFEHGWYEISQTIRGTATWTNGGPITKCGIPWSTNNYMTVAISPQSPYRCGQKLRIRNLSSQFPREIVVTVVDTVEGFPRNRINLHRRAFEALGAPTSIGLISVEITPIRQQVEYAKWGRLLLNLTKDAFPNYKVIDYQFVGSERISDNQVREVFDFILQSNSEKINVRATVVFNPANDKIHSITFVEQTI